MSGSRATIGHSIISHVVAAVVVIMLVVTFALAAQTDNFLEGIPFLVLLMVFIAVGWLLAARRPDNPLGWLLLAIPGLFTLSGPATVLGLMLVEPAPAVAAWLLWYGYDRPDTWAWLPPIGLLLTQIPLRFPSGDLPSPKWRWFSVFTIVTLVVCSLVLSTASVEVAPGVPNPVHVGGIVDDSIIGVLPFAAIAIAMIGSLSSLFVRARRAGPVESAQLRWMLWSVTIVVLSLIAAWTLPGEGDDWSAVQLLVTLLYGLIPISIAVAVMRYRLYEIDRIISRTVAYALVTIVVVGIYALTVTSVALLLPEAPTLGVALATLTAAAVFLPVLRTVRKLLDRRFNRAQYDAERVVESFGQRLRTVADPHTAPTDLLSAVERTLEPDVLGIWAAPTATER